MLPQRQSEQTIYGRNALTNSQVDERAESVRSSRTDSLRDRLRDLKGGWWLIALCAIGVGLIAFFLSIFQTPIYRSSAVLYVTSGADSDATSAYQGSLASQQRVASYAKLVTSDAIIDKALAASGIGISVPDAKEAVSAAATQNTVLLTVNADRTDPAEATALANAVATSLSSYVATLETPVEGSAPIAKLTVVSPATRPDHPISPKTRRNTAAGLFFGGLLGVVALAIRTRFDTRIRTVGDVTESTTYPVLGAIPYDSRLSDGQILDFSTGSTIANEAYRKLRVNLGFIDFDNDHRTIVVTSPASGDGKSTVAGNIALSLAETGFRVLLVDADLRRPDIALRFGLSATVGLSDCLRGSLSLDEVVQRSVVGGIDVISSGELPPNPTELLSSTRMSRFMDAAKLRYDYVIVDAAPINPVADTVVLSQWADGAVLVFRTSKTTSSEIRTTSEQLDAANVRVFGAIINGTETSGDKYYQPY